MSKRLYIYFFTFLISWCKVIQAQEQEFLDDSTKDVYGLETTFFITPADLKYNRAGFRPLRIHLEKLDRFTYRQRLAYKLQDLGNEGTAAKYVFYKLPIDIGVHSGFHAYDIYFRDPLQLKYYDAKAPYTDGTVVFANYGSFIFDVTHARSFNKNWHLGAIFETTMTDREYIPLKIPYDRQVITYPFTLFGHYKSDQERYQALLSFYRKNHHTREMGGIWCKDVQLKKLSDWLKPKAETINNLTHKDSVQSGELRQQYYLYHQAVIAAPLHVYHEMMLRNTFNYFSTSDLKTDHSKRFLAGNRLTKQDNIQDTTIMQTFSNEFGIKGQIHRVFYQYYYRTKQINLESTHLTLIKKFKKFEGATQLKEVEELEKLKEFKKRQEHYLGIYTRTNLRDSIDFLHLGGEYLQGDFYKIHAAYEGSIFEFSYDHLKYQPSLLSVRYRSPYRLWNKKFEPPTDTQLEGACRIAFLGILLRPYGRFVRTQAPIYFRLANHAKLPSTAIQPFQANGHADMTTWGANMNLTIWSHFHVDTETAFTQVAGPAADVLSIPKWYSNIRTYYAKSFQEGKSDIETGIECNWKSNYKADAYDPMTQQFFIQNVFTIYSYPIIELFFNFRIKTFRGFLKIVHINQGIPKPGYFVTPFYPGQLRSIDLGFSWSLFD